MPRADATQCAMGAFCLTACSNPTDRCAVRSLSRWRRPLFEWSIVASIEHTDMVVLDRDRAALDQALERAIATVLRTTFVESFDSLHYRFYVRQDHLIHAS